MTKQIVAVFFGGLSPEHDVSILTGLKAIEALDVTKYEALPVYIDQKGDWWTGEALLDRANYHFNDKTRKKLTQIDFPIGRIRSAERPFLAFQGGGLFNKSDVLYFDVALIAFHGSVGEDGMIQGLLETAGVPYTGADVLSSSIFMSKPTTKRLCRSVGIPVLDQVIVPRPPMGETIDIDQLEKEEKITFPVCIKPCNLGSSVGVFKVDDIEDLHAALIKIFKMDTAAMIEPYVENLVEYNISISNAFGEPRLSAVERPARDEDGNFLSFGDKYLSQGGIESKLGGGMDDAGMETANRTINPEELSKKQMKVIEDSAYELFRVLTIYGAPRIDFLCDEKSGKIWLNEVNTIPGSMAYYLWEAAEPKVNFTSLLSAMIDEGLHRYKNNGRNIDLSSSGSSIFPKN